MNSFKIIFGLAIVAITLEQPAAAVSTPLFSFQKIADASTPAPGGGTFENTFSDESVDDQGNVAFISRGSTAPSIEGVYAWIGGTMIKIMDESAPLPGTAVTFPSLDDHVEIRDGIAIFHNNGASGTRATATSDGTSSHVVVSVGDVLPSAGGPTVTFLYNSEGFGFDGTRTAFRATFSGGQGVYLEDGAGNLTKVADTNDIGFGGDPFDYLTNPMPDAHGSGVAFFGGNANGSGVFVWDGGTSTVIADNVTDFAPSAPGNTVVLYSEIDIDGGSVVFRVFEFDNSNAKIADELVLYDGSGFTTIADLSTLLPNGQTPLSFIQPLIANDTVAFVAETAAGTGMFVWRNGMISQVLNEGDVLDGSTVQFLLTGSERGYLADGYLALKVGFTGGDRAVYRVSILDAAIVPEPATATLGLIGLAGLLLRRRRVDF